MPETIQSLFILVIALLPGAMHVWAFEREAGRWGIGLTDRALRFVGVTAIYHALLSPVYYLFWTHYLHRRTTTASGTVYVNVLADGQGPTWMFVIPLAYVGVPAVAGTLAAVSLARWPRLARILAGRVPAPRAWDYLFFSRPAGVVRARLKSDGRWVGGFFGADSYASGYPEEPQDLYLERAYLVQPDGEFAEGPDPDSFLELGSGLLLRWNEIEELEFFPEVT